jgi:hypothetical protein
MYTKSDLKYRDRITVEDVKIFQNFQNKYVPASIVPISVHHIYDIDFNWKPQLRQERAWDQELELSTYLHSSQDQQAKSEIYILECNLIAQGLIVFTPGIQLSRLEPSKGILYLNWLSVAPWNRRYLTNLAEHKGVGTALFTFAILRSIDLGLEGRIGLHTVKNSEKFYDKLQLTDLGYDTFKTCKLKYLELSPEKAELILLNSLLMWNLN